MHIDMCNGYSYVCSNLNFWLKISAKNLLDLINIKWLPVINAKKIICEKLYEVNKG